ncbi:MAG: tripartite tricarboxylate transporter permease, partial [Thermoplasmatota archaeon]
LDLDPIGDCAPGLAVPQNRVEYTAIDLLEPDRHPGESPADWVWQITRRLDLLPSTEVLATWADDGRDAHCEDPRLRFRLNQVADRYEYCVIDTPPALGRLTWLALQAGHEWLFPVDCDYLGLHGAVKQMPLLLAVVIAATSIAHTFTNIIPSTFLGAPEEDTALVMLPAHALLRQGQGYRAVALSAIGSAGAIVVGLAFIIPYRMLLGSPGNLYSLLVEVMPWVLLAVSVVLIGTEKDLWHVAAALILFLLAGVFGMAVFQLRPAAPLDLPGSLLFPALSGLFAIPTLIYSMQAAPVPEQDIGPATVSLRASDVGTGAAAGAAVSILPGVTAAVATVLALVTRDRRQPENVIVTLSAVNTSNAFFVLAALFVIGRARSGSATVIQELLPVEMWKQSLPPSALPVFIIAVLLAAMASYYFTRLAGRMAARRISMLPYRRVALATMAGITIMVFLFTGLVGLLCLLAGSFIGLLCLEWRVRRSVLMGVLLIPILLYYL